MKIPTVERFFCLNLEASAKLIGWSGIITGSIGAILAIAATIFVCTFSCEDLIRYESFRTWLEQFSVPDCSDLKFVLVSSAVFCLISITINGTLLRGIQTLNHVKILPAIYLFGFEILSLITLQFGSYTALEIFGTLILAFIMIYLLIALFSLYVKVRYEYQGRVILSQFDEIN